MPDLERVQQNTPGTLSQVWQEDGVAVDPGTVTIGITRADGTTLVAAGAATTGTAANPRTYAITTTHTALLDRLKVTWSSSLKGTMVSYLEVVGGFLFTLAEARVALGDPAYSIAKIVTARLYAETELESAVGYALVPRYSYETVFGLRPRWPYIRAVRSASSSGVAWSQGELDALIIYPDRLTTSNVCTYWTYPRGPIRIGYEHGLDGPPPGANRAALATAVEYLGGGTGTVDPRAERLVTDDGTLVFGSGGGGQFRGVGVNDWVAANRMVSVA